MTTTTTPQGVPIPARVAKPDIWQNDVPQPYRVLFGELRNIDGGSNYTTVQGTAVQFADGRIDDGRVHEAPRIYLGDDGLTSAQARDSPPCSSGQPTRLIGGRRHCRQGVSVELLPRPRPSPRVVGAASSVRAGEYVPARPAERAYRDLRCERPQP